MSITKKERALLLSFQHDELLGYHVYKYLAKKEKDLNNKDILNNIASDELDHYKVWFNYTKEDVKLNKFILFYYQLVGLIFGYTFVIKIMEKNEYKTSKVLEQFIDKYPEVALIMKQEDEHEKKLIDLLDEDRLQYIGSMVLGLNDALVELTGTIAGLTFAFANNKLVALSGIITGIAATLSMAASNYLAQRADGNENAFKSSLYTGIAYLITVILLVLPYLLLPNDMYALALIIMLVIVIFIIFVFNYYVAITKDLSFKKQFFEMLFISLGVAIIAFVIGVIAKQFLRIDL